MINVAEVLSDPDFAQTFTIQRTTGVHVLGGYQTTAAPVAVLGVVIVAGPRELEQLPEGDKVKGGMLFFSTFAFYLSHAGAGGSGVSDTILWRGDLYRLAFLWPYADYGFWKALGVRISGE